MRSFKVLQRSIIALCAIVVFSGCEESSQSGEVVYVHGEKQAGVSWEDYLRQAEVSVDGKVAYVVEGDLFFATKASLRTYYEETILNDGWKLAVFQRISDGMEPVYSPSEARDITYCVSNLFQSSFQPFDKNRVVNEAATAMDDWERVANVRFRYVPAEDASCTETNTNVDFAIIPITMFGGCAANRKMWGGPSSWCPNTAGQQVMTGGLLGMNYGGIGSVPSSTGVFRHELGHMLGFRHEHPFKPGSLCTSEQPTISSDDLTFRRLTEYDVQSVMHYTGGSCTPSSTEYMISKLDGAGVRSVYGMPTSWLLAVLDD